MTPPRRLATPAELRARLVVAVDSGDERLIPVCRAALTGDPDALRELSALLDAELDATESA